MGSFLEDFGNASPQAAPQQPTAPAPQSNSFLEEFGGQKPAVSPKEGGIRITPVPDEEPVPSWSEIPGKALGNLPASAGEFAKNVVQPFIHPIDTAESIGNVALGGMEKLGLYGPAGYEKHADAVGKMIMDRYGSVDNLKKTLAKDPVGVIGDLSILLGGETAAARVIEPLTNTIAAAKTIAKPVANLATKTGTEALGVLTGTGGRPIEEAARAGFEGGEAGKAFRENMRGNVPIEDVVKDASNAVSQMRKERGADYRANMAKLGLDNTVLDFGKLDDAFKEVGTVKKFKGQDLSPTTNAIREKIDGIVNDWYALPASEYHTPEGFDALKQKIGDIRDSTQAHTPERVVADKYYRAARQTIVDQVPEYAKMMKGYEEASDIIRQIEKTLSIPTEARKGPTIDTSLRKLQSVLRNNVSSNFGQRQRLVEYLQNSGAPHIISALAGQSMNSWVPRGLARLAAALGLESEALTKSGKIAAALPLASPRIMGEAAHLAGRAASPIKYLPRITPGRSEAAFQMGRISNLPEQARGGAVQRALNIAKKRKG